MSSGRAVMEILSQLSNVLPTGTFLVFQVLAPLSTNNGKCGRTEVVLTAIMLALLGAICVASCFTDSHETENGEVYYGFVTPRGLWNPTFRNGPIRNCRGCYYQDERYHLEAGDFVNAVLSGVALAAISLLTDPVVPCFYPDVQQSVQKTVPLLVGLAVAAVCALRFTTPRNGVGFAMAPAPPRPQSAVITESSPLTASPNDGRDLASSSTS